MYLRVKSLKEDHSFEHVEALFVFFWLRRYPERLGLLCGSKTEAHGALRAQPSEHAHSSAAEIAKLDLRAAGRRERPF